MKRTTPMSLEQYTGVVALCHDDTVKKSQLSSSKSVSAPAADSEDSRSASFECNICLDAVQDPVVTLCGHLYCWPCIYRWLEDQGDSSETEEPQPQQCPVCRAEVCTSALVPLHVAGRASKPSKPEEQDKHPGIAIPERPLGMGCSFGPPRTPIAVSYGPRRGQQNLNHVGVYGSSPTISSGGTAAGVMDPLVGMIGEILFARISERSPTNFRAHPNSYHLAGSSSPRLRRHMMQADKSLSRVCFFLFCCILLCLLLF